MNSSFYCTMFDGHNTENFAYNFIGFRKTEFEDWADEMARKGLFQAVPKGGFPKKTEEESK